MIGLNENLAGAAARPADWLRLVDGAFAEGGWLQASLELEHRPQQERMAHAVAMAFDEDSALLAEAGTGVGKSLAYLVPGLIRAQMAQRQMLVSTHTIALQEQIQIKDLELVRRLFRSAPELVRFADFRSALLVGKGNYLCSSRLAQAIAAKVELFPTAEQEELLRIAAWATHSADGLRHELNPPPHPEVWEAVHADSGVCNRKNCNPEHCPYQRARARLRDANLVIVNHSLLFSLLNSGGATDRGAARGILFPNDFLVLDEAHTVPEVATEHFGLRLTSYALDRFLKSLHHPQRKRGLLQKLGSIREQQTVEDCIDSASLFFQHIRERVLAKQPVVRIREADTCEPLTVEPFKILSQQMRDIGNKLEDGPVREELAHQRSRLDGYFAGIEAFLVQAEERHVHWVERSGKHGQIVALRTAPIDVAPLVHEALFTKKTSVVLTSATLAMGGEIAPFQARIGAEDERIHIEDSPFDYARNMRVYVAADMPQPTAEDPRLALDSLVDYLRWCLLRVEGGSLVLFTSYTDLNRCAEQIEPDLRAAGRPLFVQGQQHNRTELVHRFRQAGNGVLCGTDSFWTGIDVPGDALSQVVITRLPFDVPTHPIAEARAEEVRGRGGMPFNEITLPEALVKFRQGIGRLIRTRTDRGLITILDTRVLTKTYGRLFLGCLPVRQFARITKVNRESLFQPFPAR
jgi:ATP-dependent DNA helicase DinG